MFVNARGKYYVVPLAIDSVAKKKLFLFNTFHLSEPTKDDKQRG